MSWVQALLLVETPEIPHFVQNVREEILVLCDFAPGMVVNG